tara:strand:+ start:2858 stop:3052 length:195 start_codon:yes stop_codon:yes gene_type:complete
MSSIGIIIKKKVKKEKKHRKLHIKKIFFTKLSFLLMSRKDTIVNTISKNNDCKFIKKVELSIYK